MRHSHALLKAKLELGEPIYGVTTGFGGNSHYQIPPNGLCALQTNLLKFLKAGTGDYLPTEVVRASMLLRVNALALGWSCPRVEVAIQLLDFLNHGITPLVPKYGSVGASGDLIPSAYIANCLCGNSMVRYGGAVMPATEALMDCGLQPLELEPKEGLALVNGTTMMTALAVFAVHRVKSAFHFALGAIAMAAEGMGSSADYYAARIQAAKGHPGQIAVAGILRSLLAGSRLTVRLEEVHNRIALTGRIAFESHAVERAFESVQAPYSLRCVPQGLGPMWETLRDASEIVEREVNSVNDNPLIDPESAEVLHTGNFYGGHIARAMDGLKIDISTLANWLHSVVAMLMDSRFSNGLPNSLSPSAGLYHGFKGLQLCHSSLVTLLRQQSAPSSVHTLPTEQYNQDIVSLGTHAALTAFEMGATLRDAVAMTLLAAAQAVDLREGADKLADDTRSIYRAIRRVSPFLKVDRPLDADIAEVSAFINGSTQLLFVEERKANEAI
jgi:phenylalanine ammonia-lyase